MYIILSPFCDIVTFHKRKAILLKSLLQYLHYCQGYEQNSRLDWTRVRHSVILTEWFALLVYDTKLFCCNEHCHYLKFVQFPFNHPVYISIILRLLKQQLFFVKSKRIRHIMETVHREREKLYVRNTVKQLPGQ